MRIITKFYLAFLVLILTACGQSPSSPQATIVAPIECRVKTNGEMPLSIVGFIPEKALIRWEASAGTVSPDNGVAVIYQAPSTPGNVMITAKITSGGDYSISYPCLVEIESTDVVSSVETPIVTPEITSSQAEITNTTTDTPASDTEIVSSIVISEVMGDPCGGDPEEVTNEYVELYNIGNEPVDVTGWFIGITRNNEEGDKLISWQTRYPKHELGTGLILNSGVIQPGSFAVILSPFYSLNKTDHTMPYTLPQGTVILTVEAGKRIGNDSNGILGSDAPADGVYLYIGTSSRIDNVISTYGVESVGMTPETFKKKSGLPLIPNDCNSVQRKIPGGGDFPENWEIIRFGNPGEGPY